MATTTATDQAVLLGPQDLRVLLQDHDGPCISIHIATDPRPAERDQNRIRFKNAIAEVEKSLGDHVEPGQRNELLQPLLDLLEQSSFFSGKAEGLVVYRSPELFIARRVAQLMPQFTVVANSFHVKPMIRAVQSRHPYMVLCVSQERVALYRGDELHLREVPLHAEVPTDMADALGAPAHVGNVKTDIRDPEDSDQRDSQLKRYFRRLDQALLDHHLDTSSEGLPLLLAALPEYHHFYHEASHYPHLLEDAAIRRDPFKDLDHAGLVELAAEAFKSVLHQQLADFRERFGGAKALDQASDELEDVAKQAVFGKIETLVLDLDYRIGGKLDPGTGEVTRGEIDDPATDDLTDDIAETVLKNSGQVLIASHDDLPTGTGIAAVHRFAIA